MSIEAILKQIDLEVAKLNEARRILSVYPTAKPKPVAIAPDKKAKKRNLSPEGRKRIQEAVKRRWQLQKKAAKAA